MVGGDEEGLSSRVPREDEGLLAAGQGLALGRVDAEHERRAAVFEQRLAEAVGDLARADDAHLADEVRVAACLSGDEEAGHRPHGDGRRDDADPERAREDRGSEDRRRRREPRRGERRREPREDDREARHHGDGGVAEVERLEEPREVVARVGVARVVARVAHVRVADVADVAVVRRPERVEVERAQDDEGPVDEHDAQKHRQHHRREGGGEREELVHDRRSFNATRISSSFARSAASCVSSRFLSFGSSRKPAVSAGPTVAMTVETSLPTSVRGKMSE